MAGAERQRPTLLQPSYHVDRMLKGLLYYGEHPTTRLPIAFPEITQLIAETAGTEFPEALSDQLGLERQPWQQVVVHGTTLDSQLFIAGETETDQPLPVDQAQAVISVNPEVLQVSGTHKDLHRIVAVGFNLGEIMEPYGALVSVTDEEFMKPPRATDYPSPTQPAHGQWREIYHPDHRRAMLAYSGTAAPFDHQQTSYSKYGIITPAMAQQTGHEETPAHTQLLKVIFHGRYSQFATNIVLHGGLGINFPQQRGFSVKIDDANYTITYAPPEESPSLQPWQIKVPQRLQRA